MEKRGETGQSRGEEQREKGEKRAEQGSRVGGKGGNRARRGAGRKAGRQKPWLTGQGEQQQAGQCPGSAAGIPGMRLHRCGERSPRLHSAAPRPARRLGLINKTN